jgi:hypothetical protein
VVLWTENSIRSKWVRAEANLGDSHEKLICLRDPKLDPKLIPMPFAEAHMIELGKRDELLAALARTGAYRTCPPAEQFPLTPRLAPLPRGERDTLTTGTPCSPLPSWERVNAKRPGEGAIANAVRGR